VVNAVVPPRRGDGGSSFRNLAEYLGREREHGTVLVGLNVASVETAAREMELTASASRCRDPVMHLLLSWQEDERPTDDQMVAAARHALKGLGYQVCIGVEQ
jgi:hypothetical protein